MWTVAANLVRLELAAFSCDLDTENPSAGLHDVAFQRIPIQCRLLTTQAPFDPRIADSYVRGSDLIVAYHQTSEIRPQINWHAEEGRGGALKVVVTVSIQTSLLVSDPNCQIASDLPRSEMFAIDLDSGKIHEVPDEDNAAIDTSRGVLFRPHDEEWSLAQLVHPVDCIDTRLRRTSQNGVRLTHSLFPDNLEKGVILKGRGCALLLPRSNDVNVAVEELRDFVASPLPLTT